MATAPRYTKPTLGPTQRKLTSSRILPVRPRCSERQCFPDQPFMRSAAKEGKEPEPGFGENCGIRHDRREANKCRTKAQSLL